MSEQHTSKPTANLRDDVGLRPLRSELLGEPLQVDGCGVSDRVNLESRE